MPHLAPMNWIMFMLLTWTTIALFMTNTWWLLQNYKNPLTNKKLLITNNWKW